MTELLFDAPWWLLLAIVGTGAYVAYDGNRKQEKQLFHAGLAILLLGILLAAVSYVVDTDRETAIKRTRGLVAAVNARDWNGFRALLDPQTSIYGFRGPDSITRTAQTAAERYRVSAVRITGTDVQRSTGVITIAIRVYSESGVGSLLTDWQFQYQDFGQGWVLHSIRALSNEQIPEDRISRELSQP